MRRFLAIPILIFAAFTIFVYLVVPQYKQYSKSSQNASVRQESLKRKVKHFADLRKTVDKLNDFEEEIAKIDTALPVNSSYPSLFHYIQNTASSNGLILTAVEPIAATLNKNGIAPSRLGEMQFSVSLVGRPQSLESFLITVEKSARMFETISISMAQSGGDGELPEITIAMKAYIYTPTPTK